MFKSISRRAFSITPARSNFAKMQLIGSVANVQAKETKDGSTFLTYALAVSKFSPLSPADDFGKRNVTEWYNITVFDDKQVSLFQNYMGNGARVYVEADVKQRTVIDENENKLVFTSLTQTKVEVLRFPKKPEADVEEVEV